MVPTGLMSNTGTDPVAFGTAALAQLGYTPLPFQREVWQALGEGRSGLLHAGTGAGKTYALWGGALAPLVLGGGLQLLWITPMRALAQDTQKALARLASGAKPGLRIESRTGDTASSVKSRQDRSPPEVLITTPESLCVMLSRPEGVTQLARVRTVVADEWHELLGTKRGVQLQLALTALPGPLCVWGISATLADPAQALAVLTGSDGMAMSPATAPASPKAAYREQTNADQPAATPTAPTVMSAPHAPEFTTIIAHPPTASTLPQRMAPVCIQAPRDKPVRIDTLLPPDAGRFPWAGHLGLAMLPALAEALDAEPSSLVFTNTRAQAELWYQALLDARPDWAGLIALHHGSLERETREWVEGAIGSGQLKVVVATSSLDLGVDFSPVARVFQIGSPKGVARLLQRAGRAGHQPDGSPRVTLVPTHALEILESLAAQTAVARDLIEPREPPHAPMDVLVQHIATRVLGQPLDTEALWAEVRRAWSYRTLTRPAFDWALQFLSQGGASLQAYPEFQRLQQDEAGRWHLPDRAQARRHRMAIGTIVSDASVQVAWVTGGRIGQVEESFIGRLKKGDTFFFAGRTLELVRVKDLTAQVRLAQRKAGAVPRWNGGKMPLSTELGRLVRELLPALPDLQGPEAQALAPLVRAQGQRSRLPQPDELLVELLSSREGHHCFVYPFAGRTVHLGLATLLAHRLAQQQALSVSYAVNDYGLELLVPREVDAQALFAPERLQQALRPDGLRDDLDAALVTGALAQRRFREIARIAGLVQVGPPGAQKSVRQLAASASLFYGVFRQYDPDHALLHQAHDEVRALELHDHALAQTLDALQRTPWQVVPLTRPSPLGFPLMVERLREQLSSEKLADRVARMLREAEQGLNA